MKKYIPLRIITAILLISSTIYSVWTLADIVLEAQVNGMASLALIAWIVVAAIALAIPLFFAIIGLIVSIVSRSRSQCTTGTLIYFIVFTVLPFVVYFGSILAVNLLI